MKSCHLTTASTRLSRVLGKISGERANMANEEPTLLFFRHRPDGLATKLPIASSMQSLETNFFLIALYRYPHALATCAGVRIVAVTQICCLTLSCKRLPAAATERIRPNDPKI